MPTYRFTGGYPRVLTGLSEGVNAHRVGTPPGATIEAHPGDTIRTDAPYPHPELVETDGAETLIAGLQGVADAGAAGAAGIDVLREAAAAATEPAPAQPEPQAEPIQLTADEAAHLSPEILAAIHQAEAQATDPATHQE